MNYKPSDTHRMKADVLKWMRLEKRCAFIATEAGGWNADCLGMGEKKAIEVEVKTSISDLKADFRKPKHYNYLNRTDKIEHYYTRWIPNAFYFCVTEEIKEDALKFLESKKEQAASYGLLVWNPEGQGYIRNLLVVRRPKMLHKHEPDSHSKFILALRMGSMIIRYADEWVV